MISRAADLARRLARDAEAVCRHYLSKGRRKGRYWIVGDVLNSPGRSLYVRLHGPESGPRAAGKFTDAATGEHGDLLDLIGLNCQLGRLRDVLDEASAFLALPREALSSTTVPAPRGSAEAARRLFRAGRPVPGTLAEAYLRARDITASLDWDALRFHPSAWYRDNEHSKLEVWPALLAAVTDDDGRIAGVLRTFLDPRNPAKAPIADPRRALGDLLGNCVRFGPATEIVVAGEGIETMLSLKSALPELSMIAGLSANHLAALSLGPSWRRLYIARDNDRAGIRAAQRLIDRCQAAHVDVHCLIPLHDDFNTDLRKRGVDAMRKRLLPLLHPTEQELLSCATSAGKGSVVQCR